MTLPDSDDRYNPPFLEGPQSRRDELARVMRIAAEFVKGFRVLHASPTSGWRS